MHAGKDVMKGTQVGKWETNPGPVNCYLDNSVYSQQGLKLKTEQGEGLGRVVHTCNPSYKGARDGKIKV
jgi:hypothetical protein